jgi:hypothetical protein
MKFKYAIEERHTLALFFIKVCPWRHAMVHRRSVSKRQSIGHLG